MYRSAAAASLITVLHFQLTKPFKGAARSHKLQLIACMMTGRIYHCL